MCARKKKIAKHPICVCEWMSMLTGHIKKMLDVQWRETNQNADDVCAAEKKIDRTDAIRSLPLFLLLSLPLSLSLAQSAWESEANEWEKKIDEFILCSQITSLFLIVVVGCAAAAVDAAAAVAVGNIFFSSSSYFFSLSRFPFTRLSLSFFFCCCFVALLLRQIVIYVQLKQLK